MCTRQARLLLAQPEHVARPLVLRHVQLERQTEGHGLAAHLTWHAAAATAAAEAVATTGAVAATGAVARTEAVACSAETSAGACCAPAVRAAAAPAPAAPPAGAAEPLHAALLRGGLLLVVTVEVVSK